MTSQDKLCFSEILKFASGVLDFALLHSFAKEPGALLKTQRSESFFHSSAKSVLLFENSKKRKALFDSCQPAKSFSFGEGSGGKMYISSDGR